MHTNESKYTTEDLDNVDFDEIGPPKYFWSSIAPSTEEHSMQSIAEGNEQLTEVSQQDLQDNQTFYPSLACISDLRVQLISKRSHLSRNPLLCSIVNGAKKQY